MLLKCVFVCVCVHATLSAKAELDVASVRMSPVGSASRTERDPLSRAKQQYLEVLKKNHKI